MRNLSTLALVLIFGIALTAACSGNSGAGEQQEATADHAGDDHDQAGEEHSHDHEGEHAEESGAYLALGDTFDQVQNGARLILAYDGESNAFKGTIENTTQEALFHVLVGVHLSNGTELEPVEPGDLAPGETKDVELKATGTDFDGWSAHPEAVSAHEHTHEHG